MDFDYYEKKNQSIQSKSNISSKDKFKEKQKELDTINTMNSSTKNFCGIRMSFLSGTVISKQIRDEFNECIFLYID